MSRRLLVFLILLFVSGKLAFAQNKNAEEKSDPDSTGVVNSALLPSIAPLLLFDEEKEKDEKKEKKKKARKKISGLESRHSVALPVVRSEDSLIMNISTTRMRNEIPILTFGTSTGIILKSEPSKPPAIQEEVVTFFMDRMSELSMRQS